MYCCIYSAYTKKAVMSGPRPLWPLVLVLVVYAWAWCLATQNKDITKAKEMQRMFPQEFQCPISSLVFRKICDR